MDEPVVSGADETLGVERANLYARHHVLVGSYRPNRVYHLFGWYFKKVILIQNRNTHYTC